MSAGAHGSDVSRIIDTAEIELEIGKLVSEMTEPVHFSHTALCAA